MNVNQRVVLICVVAVIAFDAIASVISRSAGIPYEWASYGSWVLYIALGYLAAYTAARSPLKAAAIAGLVFGVADATLGWATSWILGPGRVAGGVSAAQWIFVAVIVTLLAVGFSMLGGSFARMRRSRMGRVAR
jgi:hypothetical protein